MATRIRRLLADRTDVEEKRMFGGIAFMVGGRMCCGLVGEKLMVRVDTAAHEELLREPFASPMDFTGRPMKGFLYIGAGGTSTAVGLRRWVRRAVDYAERQTPKGPKPSPGSSGGRSDVSRPAASRRGHR